MADFFHVFDSMLDSIFIVDKSAKVVYCNEPAATLFQSSVRRLTGKAALLDLIEFSEFPQPFGEASQGWAGPSPQIETAYRVLKGDKTGKVQMTVHPVGEGDDRRWVFFAHDVSLEEILSGKYRAELVEKEGYIVKLEQAHEKLEEYSKNLEKIVEQRTSQLRLVNESLNAVLNSLGQGFLTFDSSGLSGDVFTRACLDVLETNPQGKKAPEVLKILPEKRSEFNLWIKALFSEALPFDQIRSLGPSVVPHSKGRYITAEYYPIRGEGGKVREVVLVATDKTVERQAQIELERERQHASMITKYVKNKEQFLQFLQSAKLIMNQVEAMAKKPLIAQDIAEGFRLLHTLEGEAGTFSVLGLRLASRTCQQELEPYKGKDSIPADIQIKYVQTLAALREEYRNFLDENAQLIQMPKENVARFVELDVDQLTSFSEWMRANGAKNALIEEFQDRFLKERVDRRLNHYDGLIQTVAEKLGKKVKPLKIVGGEALLHPEPYLKIFSSLVHVFRNAVDHGIEPADERTWIEKEEAGQITLSFEVLAAGYRLTIQDDGQGIDPDSIRKKLAKTHPDLNAVAQSDEDVIQNIFLPGFSSKEAIGEFSGRGVGMDAVREEVVKLGGSVKVYSEAGKGTKFVLEFPKMPAETLAARSA